MVSDLSSNFQHHQTLNINNNEINERTVNNYAYQFDHHLESVNQDNNTNGNNSPVLENVELDDQMKEQKKINLKYLKRQKEIVLRSAINFMISGDLDKLKATKSTYRDPFIALSMNKSGSNDVSPPINVVPSKEKTNSSRLSSNLPSQSSTVESVVQSNTSKLSLPSEATSNSSATTEDILSPTLNSSANEVVEDSTTWTTSNINLLFATVEKQQKQSATTATIRWKEVAFVFENGFTDIQCRTKYHSNLQTYDKEAQDKKAKVKEESLKKAVEVLDEYLEIHFESLQKSRSISNSKVPFNLNQVNLLPTNHLNSQYFVTAPSEQSYSSSTSTTSSTSLRAATSAVDIHSSATPSSSLRSTPSSNESIPASVLSSKVLYHQLYKAWNLNCVLKLLDAIRDTESFSIPFFRWIKIARLVGERRNSIEC